MFLLKGPGWRGWRQQVKKVVIAMAVVVALGALYQTLGSRDSASVWLSVSFISQSSSALETQSSDLEKPNLFLSLDENSQWAPAPSPLEDLDRKQKSTVDHSSGTHLLAPSSIPPPGVGEKDELLDIQHDNTTEANVNLNETVLSQPTVSTNISSPLDGKNDTLVKNDEVVEFVGDADHPEARNGTRESTLRLNPGEDLVEESNQFQNRTTPTPETELRVLENNKVAPENGTLSIKHGSEARDNSTGGDSSSSAIPHVDSLQLPVPSPAAAEDGPDSVLSSPAQEKPGWRLKLEHELYAAKEAIANAPLVSDLNLYAPLYHNVSTFKKSYELMEQIFRVYVYQEGTRPLVHVGPTVGIYASEGRFIWDMQHNQQFIIKNPEKAHMFFLPYSVANMVTELYVPDSHTMLPIASFIKDYVNLIAAKYPFWNRTKGADHFFVSCHDWGPATARDHQELRHNAVKVVCNADLTEEFVLGKDASLPEFYLHSTKLPTRLGGPGPGRRPYLAFFAGQMHGRVRPVLLDHWKDKDPDMKIYEVLPRSVSKKESYVQHMKSSKYCICAMGYEVNSPRIVEAIYYDCVPVIIADNFVLHFSDVLNWDAFSITVPERDIPNLKDILLTIPDKRYHSMQIRLKKVRQHFLWHSSPVKYDVFHMILHSVWTSRLHQVGK